MRTKVRVESQVESFVKSLAPEPRRRLTIAIKALAHDRGDIQRLEGRLEGYSRLRVAGHRVIFYERAERGERIVDCVFAEKRAIVYDLFIRLLSESVGSASSAEPGS
jgi:mRNA-degrading endonuclease RelE of RelBE toxin-antitoxin system